MQVRYLAEAEIEDEARVLLERDPRDRGVTIVSPIPIERIINYLGLHQDVCDIYQRLSFAGRQETKSSARLASKAVTSTCTMKSTPKATLGGEGRFNFTLGHEVGHWMLHREYFAEAEQLTLLDDQSPSRHRVPRTRTAPIEWQANSFAARLR